MSDPRPQQNETGFPDARTRQAQVRFEDCTENSQTRTERRSYFSVQTLVRDVEAALEVAFLVDAVFDLDALVVELAPVAACTLAQFKPSKARRRTYFLSVPLTGTGLDLSLGWFLASVCFLDSVCPRRRRLSCRLCRLGGGDLFLNCLGR